MKTLLKTVIASTLTAIVLSASVFTSSAAPTSKNLLMASALNPEIKKVIVTGNASITLIQSNREWVSLEDGDMDKVAIKQEGNTLSINSSESEPVALTVYVKNIYRIDASNTSKVKTAGNFNLQNLQILLKDKATAKVKATTVSLYTVVGDNANLELIGKTDHHILKSNGTDKLKMDKFAALNTEYLSSDVAIVRQRNAKPLADH